MRLLSRGTATLLTAAAAFFLTYLMSSGLLLTRMLPQWLLQITAAAVAFAAAAFVWRHPTSLSEGLPTSILRGAIILGALGFSAGFFGPMLIEPESNQGPLFGILISGPLGFLLGAIGGAIYWILRHKKKPQPG